MKYLFLETIFNSPHLETSAEIALNFKSKGNKIFFSWIGYDLPWSDWQISYTKKILGASIKKKVYLIEKILKENKIHLVELKKEEQILLNKIKEWAKRFKGNNLDLKKFTYQKQYLGLGVSSSIISNLHQSKFDTKKHRNLIIKSLISSAIIYERSLSLIKKIKPKYIVTFNNRFATSLPIVLAAKKCNVKVLRHERGSNFDKYEIFKKDIHDLSYRSDNVKFYWNKEKNIKKKERIAKKYFFNRRNGIPLDWDMKKNYSSFQSSGNVPYKKKKYRIVFFTASEDEHESTKFQLTNLLWPSQETALKKLIQSLKCLKDYELFIRVHPTSEKRKSLKDQHKWAKFNNESNIHVISHNSQINSYELLDSSDLAVTYGGNIAIEAVYWKKKVISLRNGIFSKNNFIFEPKSYQQLKKYISNLEFLQNLDYRKKALPFAYYFMVFGKKFRYFNCKGFDSCFYKGIQISHLNPLMIELKKYKKILNK
jgi:hypothetical protein